MGTMACVQCNKTWYEKGPSNNTICDDCLNPKEEEEPVAITDDFQSLVCEVLTDEELAMLKDIDWNELKIMGAEHVALQLRWKLLRVEKGSVE